MLLRLPQLRELKASSRTLLCMAYCALRSVLVAVRPFAVCRYLEYLEETAAIYPFLNLPVMTIYALPSAVVIFGVVKALTQ
jgi:hypothetical protein